jgi:hypothetical protein
MLPYLATIVVLALISRNPRWIRINMPAPLASRSTPAHDLFTVNLSQPLQEGIDMTDLQKRSLLKVAALTVPWQRCPGGLRQEGRARACPGPRARCRPRTQARAAEDRFAYVGPVGDGGWTFAHDNGRKAVEKEFGDKVVTSFRGKRARVG